MAKPNPRYAVPALERGLDVIELLARHEGQMSLAEIAAALALTSSAIFRSVVVLEERGFITRQPPGDLYRLTLRLFELAHARPPVRRLLDVAVPAMRHLAHAAGHACHLSVHDTGSLLIVADVEGPGPLNLAFRLGSRWPLRTTASGRALLAFQSAATRAAWLGGPDAEADPVLAKQLALIIRQRIARAAGETMGGVLDLAVPIIGRDGAIAALAISAVSRLSAQSHNEANLAAQLHTTATEISEALGGHPSEQ
jgi:DNA-binding IclR family transcriptional regulator